MCKAIRLMALAAIIVASAGSTAAAQKQSQDTIQLPPQFQAPPVNPKILEQQKMLPMESPAEQMEKLTGSAKQTDLTVWLAGLPLDAAARDRARTGRMQRYRIYPAAQSSPGNWAGLILLADWRKDEPVDLNALYGRKGNPNWWRRSKDGRDVYKWLRGADGKQKGVLVVRPGNGFVLAFDLDGDRSVDLMGAMDFAYNIDWIIGDKADDILEGWAGKGLAGLCGLLGDGDRSAAQSGNGGMVDLGALDICGKGGSQDGNSSADNVGSGSGGSPDFSSPLDGLGDMCEEILAAGPPGGRGSGIPGSVKGDDYEDPYWTFDWGKAWKAFKDGGVPGSSRAGPLGQAADLAGRIGDALRAGVPEPVNRADFILR
ncbi:MAG: hypothetical protein OEZ03_13085, partial [Alphaproteobacteria bacterium]|nr:hypothetical protein [Alphaproteobacteria bacterium]